MSIFLSMVVGVTLDRALSFNTQVEIVAEQAANKVKMMSALSYSDWGGRKTTWERSTIPL